MQDTMNPAQAGFTAEELELLAYILEDEGAAIDEQQLIRPRAPDAPTPLSFAQERLWFLDQWDPGNPAYNVPFAVRLTGQLSVAALEQSLNEIVRRHEALRTTFPALEGQPYQLVAATLTIPLTRIDRSELPPSEHNAEIQRLMLENAKHRFALASGPLIRADLVRLAEQVHVFLLTIHHIVFDGWSVGLFLRELTILYDAFTKNEPSPLPELVVQYPDFAIWQRDWLQGEVLNQQFAYWQQQLGGTLPVLELPGDYPRPNSLTYQGTLYYYQLPAALSAKLAAFSQNEGVTLFMTLFAAFQVWLYRYSNAEDIVTGSLIANRDFVDIEALMGFFVNTLLLRTDQSGNPTFREFLQRVREVTLEAYAHQNVPFEQLVEELRPVRDTSHTPLFQVMFILQNAPVPPRAKYDLEVEFLRVDNGTAKFDLSLSLTETPNGLIAVTEYRTDLFEAATIERMMGHYQLLLEGIVANADCRIADLPLLTAREQQQLSMWNATEQPFAEQARIHELFEAQAARTPDAPALEWANQQLSYRQLNERANQLAHHLNTLGVQPEELVGVCMERSFELIVALLGVLKAGAAYVPLDPTYPVERLQFMSNDARIRVVLTRDNNGVVKPWFSGLTLDLQADWPLISQQPCTNAAVAGDSRNLAYVIYTSGSLGVPKGVLIEHRSLVHYTQAAREAYRISASDRVLQFASVNFDASVEEIYPTLTSGATLVLRNDDMIGTIASFLDTCRAWNISLLSLPTAYWHELVVRSAEDGLTLPPSLRLLIIGGERALPERVATWQEHVGERVQLINTYGPTEATVVATMYPVSSAAPASRMREVPIGRPLPNLQAHVLDAQLRPVPIGVPGELCLSGAGLARGYLNRPALTAERFVRVEHAELRIEKNNASSDSCSTLNAQHSMYRTGDLVRWRNDGELEFLGRVDHQVKIRGFRVELGEIEAVLREHADLADAVVTARDDGPGDKRLVAYIVPREATSAPNGSWFSVLGSFLRAKLPDYMVPSAFVTLERLPLTRSGKIDLQALPAPGSQPTELARQYVAPRTPTEEQVSAVWMHVLKLKQVGIHDNFFELGGHSLLATQILARIRTTFQVDLPLRHLFGAPTVAGVAEMIDTMVWASQPVALVAAGADEELEEGEL